LVTEKIPRSSCYSSSNRITKPESIKSCLHEICPNQTSYYNHCCCERWIGTCTQKIEIFNDGTKVQSNTNQNLEHPFDEYWDEWVQCRHDTYHQTETQCWGPMPLLYIWVEWTRLRMVLIEQDVQQGQLSTVRILLRWWQKWKSQQHAFSQAEYRKQTNG